MLSCLIEFYPLSFFFENKEHKNELFKNLKKKNIMESTKLQDKTKTN